MKFISEERARLCAELEISEEKIRRATAQLSDENEKETLDKVTALMLERMQLRKNLDDLWRKEERADKGSSELDDRTKIAIGHFHDKVEWFCNSLTEENDDSKKETLYSNQGILYALEYLFDFDGDKCIGFAKDSIDELFEEKVQRNGKSKNV